MIPTSGVVLNQLQDDKKRQMGKTRVITFFKTSGI